MHSAPGSEHESEFNMESQDTQGSPLARQAFMKKRGIEDIEYGVTPGTDVGEHCETPQTRFHGERETSALKRMRYLGHTDENIGEEVIVDIENCDNYTHNNHNINNHSASQGEMMDYDEGRMMNDDNNSNIDAAAAGSSICTKHYQNHQQHQIQLDHHQQQQQQQQQRPRQMQKSLLDYALCGNLQHRQQQHYADPMQYAAPQGAEAVRTGCHLCITLVAVLPAGSAAGASSSSPSSSRYMGTNNSNSSSTPPAGLGRSAAMLDNIPLGVHCAFCNRAVCAQTCSTPCAVCAEVFCRACTTVSYAGQFTRDLCIDCKMSE
jgi:hypothetical protein